MAPRKRRAEQMIAPPAPAGDPAPDIDEPDDDELDPAADDVRRGTRPGLRLRRGDRRNRFRAQSED
jgi:hypothetical protein